MAPSIDVIPILAGDPQISLNEKAPILLEVSQTLPESLPAENSLFTSSIEPALSSRFELEDHPIDEGRNVRVGLPGRASPSSPSNSYNRSR